MSGYHRSTAPDSVVLTGQGDPERIQVAAVTSNYLSMLASAPVTGRFFSAEDDRVVSQPVVVLSHRLWRTRFNADSNIVGKAITIDGKSYEVIGVAPRDFSAP